MRKVLRFDKQYKYPILDGLKTITIRMGRKEYETFDIVNVTFNEMDSTHNLIARITSTYCAHLLEVPIADLLADGFDGYLDCRRALSTFYPEITGASLVTVIKFEIIE